jgi:P2-related tail formation protein
MAQLTIQPSINDVRSRALLNLNERMDAFDLTPILVYRLDSVPDSALLFLAWQFDLVAPQWQLGAQLSESIDSLLNIDALSNVDTLSSTGGVSGPSDFVSLRALLKVAIPLHRIRGTPYAIKAALKPLGWSDVTLLEGQSTWGGTSYPANEGWAVFRAQLHLATGQSVVAIDTARIIAAINFFKPVRAWLDSLWFVGVPIIDNAPVPRDSVVSIFSRNDAAPAPIDTIGAPAWPERDIKFIAPFHDGHFLHTGITYGINEPAVADSGVTINGIAISATH